MNVETITLGAFATNCYLVWSESLWDGVARPNGMTEPPHTSALLVDCAGEADEIIDRATRLGLSISLIVTTHGHIDHIESLAELKRRTGARVAMHELDAPMLADMMLSGAAMFGFPQRSVTPDLLLREGERVEVKDAGIALTVLHTPGHTPGSICLLGDGVLFSGDCLFASGIGRTDLPGGDDLAMMRSLQRLASLDAKLVVYPGHGPVTTIGAEVAHNPWLE